jgi:hypothetical protein
MVLYVYMFFASVCDPAGPHTLAKNKKKEVPLRIDAFGLTKVAYCEVLSWRIPASRSASSIRIESSRSFSPCAAAIL